jgi:hypothetical protein
MTINPASSRTELAPLHNGPEFFGPLFEFARFVQFEVSRLKIRVSVNGSYCLSVAKEKGRHS